MGRVKRRALFTLSRVLLNIRLYLSEIYFTTFSCLNRQSLKIIKYTTEGTDPKCCVSMLRIKINRSRYTRVSELEARRYKNIMNWSTSQLYFRQTGVALKQSPIIVPANSRCGNCARCGLTKVMQHLIDYMAVLLDCICHRQRTHFTRVPIELLEHESRPYAGAAPVSNMPSLASSRWHRKSSSMALSSRRCWPCQHNPE